MFKLVRYLIVVAWQARQLSRTPVAISRFSGRPSGHPVRQGSGRPAHAPFGSPQPHLPPLCRRSFSNIFFSDANNHVIPSPRETPLCLSCKPPQILGLRVKTFFVKEILSKTTKKSLYSKTTLYFLNT